MIESSVIALVVGLLFLGSPAAIAWFVIAVCVYSVYRSHACGRHAHIFDKHRKFLPSFAKFNASTSVVWIVKMTRVCASSFSGVPYAIHMSLAHAVCRGSLSELFSSHASARFSETSTKVVGVNNLYVAAVAGASVFDSFCSRRSDAFKYNQPFKSFPNHARSYSAGIVKHNILREVA